MSHPQDLSSPFADDDPTSHRITGRHAGLDGNLGDTEVIDSFDISYARELDRFISTFETAHECDNRAHDGAL
jgi:hypothetical protein